MEEKGFCTDHQCAKRASNTEIGDLDVDQSLNGTLTRGGRNSLPSEEARGTVVVWDRHRSHKEFLDSTLSECRLTSVWINCGANLSETKASTTCGIAIVALGHHLAEDSLAFKVISTLKSAGFFVIAYGHQIQTWPLGMRGKALISGAVCILDSAEAEFVKKLQHKLVALHRQRAHELANINRTKAVMYSLGIIGESVATFSLFERVLRIALLSDLPVLITGESGTGKELVAQAIHRLDPKRCHSSLIPINCSAISAALAESELFGHKKGAFTGADRERKGLFPSAHGGVLFLDEIGELRSDLQAKLLRVLQEHTVLSVGADRETPTNFRIIAATNRDLGEMVRHNEFRADLFHRLNVLTLPVSPLRERKEDLRPLVESFLSKYRTVMPDGPSSVGQDFIETLMLLELPGNVRQLENIVLRALVNKVGTEPLDSDDIPLDIWKELPEDSAVNPFTVAPETESATSHAQLEPEQFFQMLFRKMEANAWTLRQTIDYCEKHFLEEVLRQTHGNQSRAARLLGITVRSIYSKVKEYHLESKPRDALRRKQ